jgi:oligosaccharide repeat unit polymerase
MTPQNAVANGFTAPYDVIPFAPVVSPLPWVQSLLWILAFGLTGLLLSIIATRITGRKINPITIYFTPWMLVIALVESGIPHFLRIGERTWIYLSIGSACYGLGAIAILAVRSRRDASARSARSYDYDDRRLSRYYAIGVVSLFAYLLLQMTKLLPEIHQIGGLSGIFSGGGSQLAIGRNQIAASAASSSFTGGSFAIGILGYILFIGTLTIFWAGYYVRSGRWGRALLPLLILCVYSLLSLDRSAFIYSVLLFTFSVIFHKKETRGGMSSRAKASLATVAVLFAAVVFIPIALRKPVDPSQPGIASPVSYFADGLGGFNTLILGDVPQPPPDPGYGRWTFHGAASLLQRLGVISGVSTSANMFFVSVTTNRYQPNNVYSWLVYPLYDDGVTGLVLLGLAFGAATGWAFDLVLLRGRLRALPMLSMLMVSSFMSVYALSLVSDVRYTFVALSALLISPCVETGVMREQERGATYGVREASLRVSA